MTDKNEVPGVPARPLMLQRKNEKEEEEEMEEKEEEEEKRRRRRWSTLGRLLHPSSAVITRSLPHAVEAGSRCPVAERQDGGWRRHVQERGGR